MNNNQGRTKIDQLKVNSAELISKLIMRCRKGQSICQRLLLHACLPRKRNRFSNNPDSRSTNSGKTNRPQPNTVKSAFGIVDIYRVHLATSGINLTPNGLKAL